MSVYSNNKWFHLIKGDDNYFVEINDEAKNAQEEQLNSVSWEGPHMLIYRCKNSHQIIAQNDSIVLKQEFKLSTIQSENIHCNHVPL